MVCYYWVGFVAGSYKLAFIINLKIAMFFVLHQKFCISKMCHRQRGIPFMFDCCAID